MVRDERGVILLDIKIRTRGSTQRSGYIGMYLQIYMRFYLLIS
jgi:hypothetical protein